ncbi:hypothetical protein GCM10010129_64470 [Streptomyces fumigatiscleroticus]|nr:hypothetical protein GCM10010129_64470 [Streptomyces fumigatiscleroticus]
MTDHALRLLRQNRRLAALAAFPFGFDLERAALGHVEPVRLASGGPLQVVAGDDTGGTYFVCADGCVLYADSEGSAGVIGASVDEALELLIGLPGWRECTDLSPEHDEAEILARVTETEDEIRENHGIDEERAELRAALGLPERSPVELVGMLYTSLLRTEPDHLLLNAVEGRAYGLLDAHGRPPLWEAVLVQGRADLAMLRGDDATAWHAVAEDPVRRRLALRAAQFDRSDGDREMLRRLVRLEAGSSMTDELRLGTVLVGLYGRAEDLPLLHEVRETDHDTRRGLDGLPEPGASGEELRRWARGLDESLFGTDPADEPLFTWTGLALDQDMTEPARVALIRGLDEIELDQGTLRRAGAPAELDTSPLRSLVAGFERLGDLFQALRAQRLLAAVQDTAWDRVSARLRQACLERRSDRPADAVRTLAALREALSAPGDGSLRHWRGVRLGRSVAEEHYVLARALADAGLSEEARAVLTAGDAILGELSANAARGVRELAEETAEHLRRVSPPRGEREE